MANRFLLVSNLVASDGGQAIVAGNERVVRARLADAKFFWETDQRPLPEFADRPDLKPLDQRLERVKALNIVFHEKLGTQYERVERIAALARELAPVVGADRDLAERAARLAKADLVTEMVGEFPELQGLMGRYYATLQGEHPSVAAAVEEHYKPLGPSDRVPKDPVSVAVALADKIDTLVGFWAIDEKPTGSKDPYALRRAALGVIRIVLENEIRGVLAKLPIYEVLMAGEEPEGSFDFLAVDRSQLNRQSLIRAIENIRDQRGDDRPHSFEVDQSDYWAIDSALHFAGRTLDLEEHSLAFGSGRPTPYRIDPDFSSSDLSWPKEYHSALLQFITDRLHSYLADKGTDSSLVQASINASWQVKPTDAQELQRAAFDMLDRALKGAPSEVANDDLDDDDIGDYSLRALGWQHDPLLIVRRVEALGRFLDTEDGRNLVAGYRRAANILRIEEKKDGRSYDDMPDVAALVEGEEKALALALARASQAASEAVAAEDFEGAMRALAELRPAVDAFFETVTVNADDPALRANRLKLLSLFRRATREVADFSKIEG